MKTTQIIIIIVIIINIVIFPQKAIGEEYNMTEINQKINLITNKKLHLMETVLDEDYLFRSQEFINLQEKCSTDWAQIIANFDKIDGGDDAKKLVIYGLGKLSAQDYMTVIESLVTKYVNGSVSEGLIDSVLYPLGRMRAFAKDNFNHPRVVSALNRAKAKSNNQTFKKELDKILTGAAKASLDNFREAHQGMAEGNIPKILLAN